ncbi:MAG: OadG family protein [Oscillospiraceae bacterium]|nr:OadG family protein [Oscillospiraceae bacterium]
MEISVISTLGLSVLGLCIVFAVLAFLMAIIWIMKLIFTRLEKKPAPAAAPAAPAVVEPEKARGSCGEVSVFDVPDRTAAMIMAIVADELDAPLNELRFISIREVEDDAK